MNVTDADTDDNARISYSLVNPISGFSIGPADGILKANLTNVSTLTEDVLLTVKAMDQGSPPLSSVVPVRVKVSSGSGSGVSSLNKKDYR